MGITCLIFFILFMLDQVSKYLVQVFEPNNILAIPGVLRLDTVYNTGMGWGLLSDNTLILVVISLVASIVLGYFCMKNDWKKNKFLSIAMTLLFAGCVGNLYDRAVSVIPYLKDGRPGVVDMISFEPLNAISRLISGNNFPTFNLADAFLVIGVILWAIYVLFFTDSNGNRKMRKNKKQKDEKNEDTSCEVNNEEMVSE